MAKQRYFEDVDPGDEFEQAVVFSSDHVKRYTALPGNSMGGRPNRFNDAEAAKRDGLPGAIVPGVMQMDVMARALGEIAGDEGRVKGLEVSFRRSTLHDDTLKAVSLVTDTIDEGDRPLLKLDVFIENDRGERPLQGTAEIELPRRGS